MGHITEEQPSIRRICILLLHTPLNPLRKMKQMGRIATPRQLLQQLIKLPNRLPEHPINILILPLAPAINYILPFQPTSPIN